MKSSVTDAEQKIKYNNEKFDKLKKHAESKLMQASEEIERLKSCKDGRLSKLKAMLRKAELKVGNLEQAVSQKDIENKELTMIADDLISKVGC